jgi:hypothetical protein
MIKCRARGAALLVYGGEHTLSSPNRLDLLLHQEHNGVIAAPQGERARKHLCKLALACRFSNGESTLWLFVSVEMLKQPCEISFIPCLVSQIEPTLKLLSLWDNLNLDFITVFF